MHSGKPAGTGSTATPVSADGNQVRDDGPDVSAAHFICAEQRCVAILRRGFWAVLGGALAAIGLSLATLPWFVVVLLSVISALALLVTLRQASVPISFACDALGVYFPSRRRLAIVAQVTPPSWLFVPWSNVSSIGVQLLLDESASRKGVAFSLRVGEEERRLYFPGAIVQSRHTTSSNGNVSLLRVVFPGASATPERIAARLRGLQGGSVPVVAGLAPPRERSRR